MPNTTIQDPLLRQVATPIHAVFHPLGFRLEIETNDPRVIECAASSYGLYSAQDKQDQPVRLRAVCVQEATAGPPWPTHSFRAFRDLFTIVGSAENFLICDLQRRQATGFFSSALLDDRDYFGNVFLDAFTYMTLQRHWITPFHAACVVRNGVGICLAGDSRAGKSTLAYHCVRSGYGLLSDNAIYLLNTPTDRRLRGNPTRLNLRPSALPLFPELSGLDVSFRADGDAFVSVPTREMFPEQLVTEAAAGPVVFLDRVEACTAPSLDTVSRAEALRLLFLDRAAHIDEPHVMLESERVLGLAVSEGAYRLRYATLPQALEGLRRITL